VPHRPQELALVALAAGAVALPAPTPVNATGGIIDAFRGHSLVAVGERHRWPHEHEFLRALLRDARFAATVDDVVVEFGNQRYQALVDRYVVGGERIPLKRLQSAWTMTTQRPTGVWEDPIYRRFYIELRNLNLTLPPGRKVRLVLGDSPIDWRRIERWHRAGVGADCFEYWLGRRDEDYAAAVERKVLAKGHRGLLIAGAFHFLHHHDGNATTLLETDGHPVFVAIPYGGWLETDSARREEIESWPDPSLALVAGTWLGAVDAAALVSADLRGTPIEEVTDAYLYLGWK
jgi:hypothetical protein